MRNINDILTDIQTVCVQNISDNDVLKEMLGLLIELSDRKEEVIESINNLAEDYNKMLHQLENIPSEEGEKPLEYYSYQSKRDAYRTCVKMLKEL